MSTPNDGGEMHWAAKKALLAALVETIRPLYTERLLAEFGTGKTGSEHLRWMCKHLLKNIETFPVDKTGRWIGFIQGVLACRGLLDVDEERARTRPLFKRAYDMDAALRAAHNPEAK